YAWVKRALRLRGEDAEMEFAAALITLSGPESDHQDHVRKAIAGANNDPLLAQNLASSFRGQHISGLLAIVPSPGSYHELQIRKVFLDSRNSVLGVACLWGPVPGVCQPAHGRRATHGARSHSSRMGNLHRYRRQ